MITISNICIRFSGNELFRNISFLINPTDKIGLVGKNGAGKTTILRIIAKLQETDEGEVIIPGEQSFGYLPQEMKLNSRKNILDEAKMAFEEIKQLEQKINNLAKQIEQRDDFSSKSYLKLIDDLSFANELYQIKGGETAEAETEKVLKGLGFSNSDFERPMSEFSNGWQMRIELAKILLKNPDYLLLDEPTNHLDIESIQWLENFLVNYRGAVVLVSHDRAFLDAVSKRTIEITQGKIYDYKASYSGYIKLRAERLEQQQASFNNQQGEIKQIENFIERFRYKSTKARQVQSRIKNLEKMDKIEIDEIDQSTIHFKFPPAPSSGKVVIECDKLSKSYGSNLVLNNIEFIALKGERIAFVGKNGEGKTTLSKVIIGELEYNGKLLLGHNVKIGYYSQNQWEMLDPEKTVFETIDDIAVGDIRNRIRNILGSFLFGGESIDKKVKVLSGGEKSRLALAKLLLTPVNLLVLDEPTNHLDMRSKDILKNALLMFEGTLIIVSHDRDFLQGLTEKVIEFRNKGIREYIGDIYAFLEKRKLENLKALEEKKKKQISGSINISDNKLNYERKKENDRQLRKLGTQIKKCELEIEKLEQLLSDLDTKLSSPEKYSTEIQNGELYKNYNEVEKQLKSQMDNWESYQLEQEEIKNQY